MNTVKICPGCFVPLPDAGPQDMCPQCAKTGIATPQAGPPSLEQLQAAFPHLEILEFIGAGGMGAVYKARQTNLERIVALKLLAHHLADRPEFAQRFAREARLLARLNHPGIVAIYDFGQAGGYYYLLMEYIDGPNLRQAMDSPGWHPADALALIPPLCDALHYAHEQQILHRDIKPENILIDAQGRPKLADFGIARLRGGAAQTTVTTAGAAIGTPHYMAPEQLENAAQLDHRADLYSLGVVLYEMLTGELPLGRFGPPSHKPGVDARLDPIVLRALEPKPDRRFQTAAELKGAVENLSGPAVDGITSTLPPVAGREDYILFPPRLPRMGRALLTYAVLVAPLYYLVGLDAAEHRYSANAYAAFIQTLTFGILEMGEALTLPLLIIGGLMLRRLRPSASTLLLVVLATRLFLMLFGVGGLLFAENFTAGEELPPEPLAASIYNSLGVALVGFELAALLWLLRHRASLKLLRAA